MADTFTHGPANVTSIIASTNENRRETVNDAFFNRFALFNWLNSKGKVSFNGGRSLTTPLMISKSTAVGAYDGFDVLATDHQDPFTDAQFTLSQYYASISVSGEEDRIKNKDPHRVFNLVNKKIEHADMSLRDELTTDLFASTAATKKITPLPVLIDATSSVGDINSTTYSWWQADVNTGGSFAAQGISDLRTLWNDLSKLNTSSPPDLLMTTSDIHSYYEGSLEARKRFSSDARAKAGFDNLMFRSAEVVFDASATSGVIYFLNSDYLELMIDSDTDFIMTEWVKPHNQDAKVAQLLLALNLITTNRRMLGKINSVTA